MMNRRAMDTGVPPPGFDGMGDPVAFSRSFEQGASVLNVARRRLGAWAEENPGGVLAVGLAAGVLLGLVLLPERR